MTNEKACDHPTGRNIPLMAAAQELLDALKLAQELLERNGIQRPEIDAAIAKAERPMTPQYDTGQ